MPERDPLFTREFAVAGAAAQRILQTAKRKGLMVSVVGDRDTTERLTSVVGQVGDDPYALLLDQPAGTAPGQRVFGAGESVRLRWTDQGLHFGVQAQVVKVDTSVSPPLYQINADGGVFRMQRREAYRVPVGPNDSVHARLSIIQGAEPIIPTVKDLSTTGARLSLELPKALEVGLERYLQAAFTLHLPQYESAITSELLVLWTERSNNQVMDFGARWIDPSSEFTTRIRRFVLQKEKLLLKRRGGA